MKVAVNPFWDIYLFFFQKQKDLDLNPVSKLSSGMDRALYFAQGSRHKYTQNPINKGLTNLNR